MFIIKFILLSHYYTYCNCFFINLNCFKFLQGTLNQQQDQESPTHIKKLKIKLLKNKIEESPFTSLKSPRTYSKKAHSPVVSQPSVESLSDDTSSKQPLIKKSVSSASSTSASELSLSVPTSPISPAPVTPATPAAPTTPVVTSPGAAGSMSSKKYPKRENRKPPAHLADVFGADLLFSTPDIIKRVVKTPTSQGMILPGTSNDMQPKANETETVVEPCVAILTAASSGDLQQSQPSGKMDLISGMLCYLNFMMF